MRDVEAHAVRPEHRCSDLARASGETLCRRLGGGSGLGAEAGHDEGANACGRRFLERILDALVVDQQERHSGISGRSTTLG